VILALLLPLLACRTPSAAPQVQLDATLSSQVPTTATVSWSGLREADSATLSVTVSDGELWEQDISSGDATLWALPPDEEVTLVVTAESGGASYSSDPLVLETRGPGGLLHSLVTEGDDDRAFDGELMVTSTVVSPPAAVVIDGQGRYRWWAESEDVEQLGRARLSHDGQHILAMSVNLAGNETAGIRRFALDGTLDDNVLVNGMHHDFVELADGTLATIAYSYKDIGHGMLLAGDRIVEVAPDGTETEIWDVWEWIDSEESDDGLIGSNWSHANALDFDEETQQYTVSLLGLRALARVDRATGDLVWLMGTTQSDFQWPDGETTILERSHQFEYVDGDLLAFENGLASDLSSRAVQIHFDADDPVVSEAWSFTPDPALYTCCLGDVERLPSGDTVVDFSTSGAIIQVDPGGVEVWRLAGEVGTAFGYLQRIGQPGALSAPGVSSGRMLHR